MYNIYIYCIQEVRMLRRNNIDAIMSNGCQIVSNAQMFLCKWLGTVTQGSSSHWRQTACMALAHNSNVFNTTNLYKQVIISPTHPNTVSVPGRGFPDTPRRFDTLGIFWQMVPLCSALRCFSNSTAEEAPSGSFAEAGFETMPCKPPK